LAGIWTPPEDAPAVSWDRIETSLRAHQRGPHPHLLYSLAPASSRRAAVAVVLWGDEAGARKLVLVQRGFGAPRHPGELAFPGGMEEPGDRDLPATARRELLEELGVGEDLWEMGCFADGLAKAEIRFTPVFFRWEVPEPSFQLGPEIRDILFLPLSALMRAPWTVENIQIRNTLLKVPRLELAQAPLWGATAFVLKSWLDELEATEPQLLSDRPLPVAGR